MNATNWFTDKMLNEIVPVKTHLLMVLSQLIIVFHNKKENCVIYKFTQSKFLRVGHVCIAYNQLTARTFTQEQWKTDIKIFKPAEFYQKAPLLLFVCIWNRNSYTHKPHVIIFVLYFCM